MENIYKKGFNPIKIMLLLLILFLAACNTNPEVTFTPTAEQDLNKPETVVVEIQTDTPVPQQEKVDRVFILQSGMDAFPPEQAQQLKDQIAQVGYEIQMGEALPDDGGEFTHLVLFNPAPEIIQNISNVKTAHIIIVGNQIEEDPGHSTSFVQYSGGDQFFIAGTLAAIISDDWRIAGLFPDETSHETSIAQVFKNGVLYICGRCTPVYGPIVSFPVTASLSEAESQEITLSAYKNLAANRINTIYIPSNYLFSELVLLLHQNKIRIISDQILNGEQADWVDYAVIFDLTEAIMKAIKNPASDDQHTVFPVDFKIISNNEYEISPGKLDYLNQIIMDIGNGYIFPYSVPSGEEQ